MQVNVHMCMHKQQRIVKKAAIKEDQSLSTHLSAQFFYSIYQQNKCTDEDAKLSNILVDKIGC